MNPLYHVFTDASFVKPIKGQDPIYGIGVVVLNHRGAIEKIISTPLRSMGPLETDYPTTHEFHAACIGLKSIPRGARVCMYVDNMSVKKAILGRYYPKAGARYYRDFEYAVGQINKARSRHVVVDACYIHREMTQVIKDASAIAHNASALVTGARKRQNTGCLLKEGRFAANFDGSIKKPPKAMIGRRRESKTAG